MPSRFLWQAWKLDTSELKKKNTQEEKRRLSHSSPSCSVLTNTPGQFTSERSRLLTRAQWQIGTQASSSQQSAGNAFFVKTRGNTHARTKGTLSAKPEVRDIMYLVYTHLYPLVFSFPFFFKGFEPNLIIPHCVLSPNPGDNN